MTSDKVNASLRKTIGTIASHMRGSTKAPPEIQESLQAFRRDYPESRQTAFVIMSFEETDPKRRVWRAIQEALRSMNIRALRADTKVYHPDLYYNVLTYIYGCTFGIAVFERISSDLINPNVIFEVGYSIAIGKQVCILKDKTLAYLPTDILGKLYTRFDPHNPGKTIPPEIKKWIKDQGFQKYHLHTMAFGQPVEAELDLNELDFYILNVSAGRRFSIEGYAETSGTQINIYTSKGKRISPPTIGQGVFDRNYTENRYYGGVWNIKSTESDSYVICISGGTGSYKITATEGAHGVTVGSIEIGQSRTGTLERFQFHRWSLDLSAAAGSRVGVELLTKARQTWLELFGTESELIEKIEALKKAGNKYSAAIQFDVETPGTYMISILNSNGPYTLRVVRI